MRIQVRPQPGRNEAGGALILVTDDGGQVFIVDVTVTTTGHVYVKVKGKNDARSQNRWSTRIQGWISKNLPQ